MVIFDTEDTERTFDTEEADENPEKQDETGSQDQTKFCICCIRSYHSRSLSLQCQRLVGFFDTEDTDRTFDTEGADENPEEAEFVRITGSEIIPLLSDSYPVILSDDFLHLLYPQLS